MIGLTQRQNDLLSFIAAFTAEHDGIVPSYQEMAEGIGLAARSRIHALVLELEERGHVRRLPRQARAIEIVGPSQRTITVSASVWSLLSRYAASQKISVDKAAAQIIRDYLEAS